MSKEAVEQPVEQPKPAATLSAAEEIAQLQARIAELEKPVPKEFPKAVRFRRSIAPTAPTRIFNSRAEQDAAGPGWED